MKKKMLTSLLCIGMVAALAACGTDMQPIEGTNAGDDPERNVLPVAPIGTDIGEEEMSGEKEITAEEMARLCVPSVRCPARGWQPLLFSLQSLQCTCHAECGRRRRNKKRNRRDAGHYGF